MAVLFDVGALLIVTAFGASILRNSSFDEISSPTPLTTEMETLDTSERSKLSISKDQKTYESISTVDSVSVS